MRWFENLLPKQTDFFAIIRKQSEIAISVGEIFEFLVRNYNDLSQAKRREKIMLIKDWEHKGDKLIDTVLTHLNSSRFSPTEKEDIHHIAVALDDVIDQVDAIASRLDMFALSKTDKVMIDLTKLITKGIQELDLMLDSLNRKDALVQCVVRIKKLEHDADDVRAEAVGRLFRAKLEAREFFKRKELYDMMEKATDKVEDASNLIEKIVIKNS